MSYSIKQIDIYSENKLYISIKSSKNSLSPSLESIFRKKIDKILWSSDISTHPLKNFQEQINEFIKQPIKNKEYAIDNFIYKVIYCKQANSDISFIEADIVPVKLYENARYLLEFYQVNSFDNSALISKFLTDAQFNDTANSILGFYNSNNYVGTLNLEALGVYENHIEIESRKIDYKDDFTKLVEGLSEDIIDLISRDSSFHQNMLSKSSKVNEREENLYSSFSYIKSFLSLDKMPMYLSFLMKKPYAKTTTTIEEKYIWESDDIDVDSLIAAYQDQSNLFELDSSYSSFPVSTIPLEIDTTSYYDTTDVFENQFIKHVLELVYDYLNNIDKNSLGKKFRWEISQCKNIVSQYLDSPFFNNVSKLKYFSLNSKVLQRKYPYNKFLKFYFSWDMSSTIFLDMFDELFCMGQKDLPKMYEYFCFITFVKEFDNKYTRKSSSEHDLLKYQNNTYNFTLKSGTASQVIYTLDTEYTLKLYYNKEYTSDTYIVNGRSYSHQLDPDISIEIFFKESLIGIVHFDAKYKLDKNDKFKIEDLDKMHTYKDAIMGTLASYILYPGSKKEVFKQEEYNLTSDDVFPSVGAYPLSIDKDRSELSDIFDLIEKLITLTNKRTEGYTRPGIRYDGIEKIIGKESENI